MAGIDSLDTLLEGELKDTYDAEKQLTKALPKLAKKATADELKAAFKQHLHQTEQHIERLEQVFESLELPVKGRKCDGMKNLIKEGDDMISEAEDDATRDAVMIAAAQKVEHYEIAAYGTMRTWATVLGHDEVARLLEETLEEEKETDQTLTQIAESFVNQASAEEGDEEDEPASGRQMRGARSGSSRGSRQQAADSGRRPGSVSRAGSSRSASNRGRSR
jgi:ferritin-like metal-binding protein YciE